VEFLGLVTGRDDGGAAFTGSSLVVGTGSERGTAAEEDAADEAMVSVREVRDGSEGDA